MRCKNCGREIDNLWGFCPYCGFLADGLEDNLANIAKMFGGRAIIRQEGDSYIVILEFQGTRQAFRITPIELEEEVPRYKPSPIEHRPSTEVTPARTRRFERTEEPEAETSMVGDSMYVRVNVPDVTEEDVEVDRLEDSVEVRAYKGSTRYFKLVPIPPGYEVISKEFLPGEVIVVLKKR